MSGESQGQYMAINNQLKQIPLGCFDTLTKLDRLCLEGNPLDVLPPLPLKAPLNFLTADEALCSMYQHQNGGPFASNSRILLECQKWVIMARASILKNTYNTRIFPSSSLIPGWVYLTEALLLDRVDGSRIVTYEELQQVKLIPSLEGGHHIAFVIVGDELVISLPKTHDKFLLFVSSNRM